MTQPDHIPTNSPAELKSTSLATEQLQQLGHLSLHDGNHHSDTAVSHDIRVAGAEPAGLAPAGARPYEGTAKRGEVINQDPEEADRAIDYAQSLFPDSEFSFLGSGRYGVVLADTTGKAFKVYRDSLAYSRYEKEAGALQLLSNAGIAPKLHLFVDADDAYRLDKRAYDYTDFGFENVSIPRQNGGKDLAVTVMDQIDTAPLESAEPAKLAAGFCKVAEVFIKENIRSWDTEVAVDKSTGDIIILDVGELYQQPLPAESVTPQAKASHELEIISDIAMDFGLSGKRALIQTAYRQAGLAAVQSYIEQLSQ